MSKIKRRFRHIVSASGKRRKTDNNKKKTEAEERTGEKEVKYKLQYYVEYGKIRFGTILFSKNRINCIRCDFVKRNWLGGCQYTSTTKQNIKMNDNDTVSRTTCFFSQPSITPRRDNGMETLH